MLLRIVFSYLILSIFLSSCTHSVPEKEDKGTETTKKEISLRLLCTFRANDNRNSSAEITAYDSESKRLFVVNSLSNRLEILDLRNLPDIKRFHSIDMSQYGGGINSVAVKKGVVAAAVENIPRQKEGFIIFFRTDGTFIKKLTVGAQPDMVTYTPDGKYLLAANEGEPDSSYTNDPEGSISVINLSSGIDALMQENVVQIDFRKYNDSLAAFTKKGIRITGPDASVAQDLEPEYIAVSPDSKKAYITLQENNAVAVINIADQKLENIHALGETRIDLGMKNSCSIKGFYQPDGITSFEADNETFLITANEGEDRKAENFDESVKLKNKDYLLDPSIYPDPAELKRKDNMGKLKVVKQCGDLDGDGDIDEIYCFGSRSFTIWNSRLQKVYDSGSDFAKIACRRQEFCQFNECYRNENENGVIENPEPETVVTGKVGKKVYAFITLEKYGGVMVYDISRPSAPHFIQYINSRTANKPENLSKPEGVIFIPATNSPNGKNLVIVANEGTCMIDIYELLENKSKQ